VRSPVYHLIGPPGGFSLPEVGTAGLVILRCGLGVCGRPIKRLSLCAGMRGYNLYCPSPLLLISVRG
jgi:hypothetical protein